MSTWSDWNKTWTVPSWYQGEVPNDYFLLNHYRFLKSPSARNTISGRESQELKTKWKNNLLNPPPIWLSILKRDSLIFRSSGQSEASISTTIAENSLNVILFGSEILQTKNSFWIWFDFGEIFVLGSGWVGQGLDQAVRWALITLSAWEFFGHNLREVAGSCIFFACW